MTNTCPACAAKRLHTKEEYNEHHPLSIHGLSEKRWSDPMAELASIHERQAAEAKEQ